MLEAQKVNTQNSLSGKVGIDYYLKGTTCASIS